MMKICVNYKMSVTSRKQMLIDRDVCSPDCIIDYTLSDNLVDNTPIFVRIIQD